MTLLLLVTLLLLSLLVLAGFPKWIGSKKPEVVKKEKLSNAQNPIRPRSLSVPPISFHAGVAGGGWSDDTVVFVSVLLSLS